MAEFYVPESLTVFGSGNTRSIGRHSHSLQQLNVNALTLNLFLFSKMH